MRPLLTRGLDENGELRDVIAHPEQFKDSSLGQIPKDWEVCSIEEKLRRVIDYRGKTPKKNNFWNFIDYCEECLRGIPRSRTTRVH